MDLQNILCVFDPFAQFGVAMVSFTAWCLVRLAYYTIPMWTLFCMLELPDSDDGMELPDSDDGMALPGSSSRPPISERNRGRPRKEKGLTKRVATAKKEKRRIGDTPFMRVGV